MKAIFLNTVFALLLVVLYGCGTDNLVGIGIPPKFDHGPHFFDKNGGEKIITAENDVDWLFHFISINGSYVLTPCGEFGVSIVDNSIVGDWFRVERINNKTVRIKMDENKTGEDIYIKVEIFAGNAGDTIEIIQKVE